MKYSAETIKKICNALLELKGRTNACKEAGISYETFTVWMKKPDFSETIKKAEDQANSKGKEIAIMSIFRAMPNQWQAAAWWLERKFKEDFAKLDKTELMGKDGGPISLTQLLSSADDAKNK